VIHHGDDNVAIAVRPVSAGEAVVVNAEARVRAAEDVDVGHKIALCAIGSGGTVYRYGEPIIEATEAIRAGAWVHVHNTRPIPGDVEV
jgi:hypothetical protein